MFCQQMKLIFQGNPRILQGAVHKAEHKNLHAKIAQQNVEIDFL